MQVDSVGGRRLKLTFQYFKVCEEIESRCWFQSKTLGWLRIQSDSPIDCHIFIPILVIRGD